MTVQELKAHAYDVLSNIEALQRELQATNQKIAEEMGKVKEEPIKPTA